MRFILILLAALMACPAAAVTPNERLADPVLEARAREISRELRCVVCQNQSIDDSDASLAKDLRAIVRERLVAGDSNADVIEHIVARYGEFVLLRPRVSAHTLILWGAPFVVLLIGGLMAFLHLRGRSAPGGEAPLSPVEEARLKAILTAQESTSEGNGHGTAGTEDNLSGGARR